MNIYIYEGLTTYMSRNVIARKEKFISALSMVQEKA